VVDHYQVVGVVRDVNDAANLQPPATPFTVYKPLAQEPWGWVYLLLRGPHPAALGDALRRAVLEVDADLPADAVQTVPTMIDRSQANLRLAGNTLVAFAGFGLLLAAVGVYGVVSNLVAQRTTEFGIRLALGAQARDVQLLVLREGAMLAAIGIVAGLAGTFVVARFLGGWMPRLVSPDPLTLGLVALVLFIVALAACLVPSRRATKVDPLTALRAD
jgi:predicted lysophospholipase L1 biosynthesis ABC-type transport system permease subunit